ncbi:MAG: tRNA uridine-5-carboxymethylaminomethyl(34) synthesis GTPase MnmE [Lachnospiraceae bacterium]|nr:tRNA uridine-5-carboxymethylaminomethyl(34) synthesis GTPase MnmE [Candidatus Equihabitans merdae]
MYNDTIAAIASGMTASGIGIIRISGPEAFTVADKCCRLISGKSVKETPSHTIRLAHIYDLGNNLLDEVLVMKMAGPKSYTAEDTIEINCHGGPMVMKAILQTVYDCGCRPAEPGEFTKRAFLNGRMDLSEAEAVMDLIDARNQDAARSAVRVLNGSTKRQIEAIRELLLTHLARIEASLDDPEHLGFEDEEDDSFTDDYLIPEKMSSDVYRQKLGADLDQAEEKLDHMLEHYEDGRLRREGIRTVILGKPNAGKSSILNLLSGEERAIVTDIAGTTRDTLEEMVNLGGLTLVLTDTAGIHETDEVVERIGVEKAEKAADEADLILFVADVSRPLDEDDKKILSRIKDRKVIILLNKSDLPKQVEMADISHFLDAPSVIFSAAKAEGKDQLADKVRELFDLGDLSFNEQDTVTSERQRQSLLKAKESMRLVRESLNNHLPEDFYAIDLMDIYRYLGEVLGEDVGEDVINEVFSRFCMGK